MPKSSTYLTMFLPHVTIPVMKGIQITKGVLPKLTLKSLFHSLVTCSGVSEEEPPLAAISALGNGMSAMQDWWLAADPVELLVDAGNIVLMGRDHINLACTEAVQIVTSLNEFLQQDNIALQIGSPLEWYLQLPEDPFVKTFELMEAISQDIRSYLPKGAHKRWTVLLTELQMLLSQHSVNLHRSAKGQPNVNSLWFWGEGRIRQRYKVKEWSAVWSDHSLVKGLEQLALNPNTLYPESHFAMKELQEPGNYLIVTARSHLIDNLPTLLDNVAEGKIQLKIMCAQGDSYTFRKKSWNIFLR